MPSSHDLCIASFALLALVAVVWSFTRDFHLGKLPSGNTVRPWAILGGVLLALGFGCYGWWNAPPESPSPRQAQFVLGFGRYGWWNAPPVPKQGDIAEESTADRSLTAVYLSAQHLLLNAPAELGQPTAIQLSRIASLATILLLAYEAVTRLFANSLQRRWLTYSSNHIIICGLGRTGFQLLRHFRDPELVNRRGETPQKVIVIESNPEHDRIDAARELGAIVQTGDAADGKLLERLGAAHASVLCFVTGSDEANVEGACLASVMIAKFAGRSRTKKAACRILVHLRNGELGTHLEKFVAHLSQRGSSSGDRSESQSGRGVEVHAFNVLQQAALEIVTDRLLPVRPTSTKQVLHAVIYGCGPIAQAVALHIAEYAHFENLRRTRLTMVRGSHEAAAASRFLHDFPRLFCRGCNDPWKPDEKFDHWECDVQVANRDCLQDSDKGVDFIVNGGIVELDGAPTCPDSITHLLSIAEQGEVVPCIFICGENDEQNCANAFELFHELNGRLTKKNPRDPQNPQVHVFAYVPHRPSYARLAQPEYQVKNELPDGTPSSATKAPNPVAMVLFGNAEETCSFETITEAPQRALAELIAWSFWNSSPEDKRGELTPFYDRELWDRRSNLSAAGHVHAKLATLNLKLMRARGSNNTVQAKQGSVSVDQKQHNTMARMEHNRWMAERLLHGWTFGKAKDNAARRRPTLVDWGNLSADDQQKDFNQVADLQGQCTPENGFPLAQLNASHKDVVVRLNFPDPNAAPSSPSLSPRNP